MNKAIAFATNMILMSGILTTLAVGHTMAVEEAQKEHSVKVAEYDRAQIDAAVSMLRGQVAQKEAGYKRCTDASKPFLTDHILIAGSKPASNAKYYSGVVYEVSMKEAFAQPKGSIVVLAYCE